MENSRFLLAAPTSGSGKTTLALGLLRAFARRGRRVQPFKCGPDYIDTQYHALACGRPSVNLDAFMASPDALRESFLKYAAGADCCIAEGAMGLFDGYAATDDRGSAAEVARMLELPVVLVVDARAMAFSAAALLHGFATFDRRVESVGVIFNRVSSAGHYERLAAAARTAGIEPLGYLPKNELFTAPSRHLGLSLEHLEAFRPTIEAVADAVCQYINLERIEVLTRQPLDVPAKTEPCPPNTSRRIAVAQDEAFSFIYRQTLDRLAQVGEVVTFSPLTQREMPEADLLYLPGGYPEFYLDALSRNESMRRSVARYIEAGGRTIAECGGMMYCCRAIRDAEGRRYPMCGVLPLEATMEGMRLHLGLREVVLGGRRLRGHEFHYSRIEGCYPSAAEQFSARGERVSTPLYRYRNLLASYTHLWLAEIDPFELFES